MVKFSIIMFLLTASCSMISVGRQISPADVIATDSASHQNMSFDKHLDIAPNGLWGLYYDKNLLALVLVTDRTILAHTQPDSSWGCFALLQSWSSDSQRFVMSGHDYCGEKEKVNRVIILDFDPMQGMLIPTMIEGPINDKTRNHLGSFVAWSPDSKEVAVNIDWVEVVIVDSDRHISARIYPEQPLEEWGSSRGWRIH